MQLKSLVLGIATLLSVHAAGTLQQNDTCQIDLGIVMDSSCSIDAGSGQHPCNGRHKCPNWDLSVKFVSKVVDNVHIGPNGGWLSLVEFARQISDNLLPTGNLSEVHDMISELPKYGPGAMGCSTTHRMVWATSKRCC